MDRIGLRFFFCLKKGFFWGNWLTLLFSTYCVPLYYNVSKKYWQIMRYEVLKFWAKVDTNHPLTPTRFCNFGPNWDQISEFSLLEQGMRRSPALAKYFLILYRTTKSIIVPTAKYVRYVTGKSYREKIVEILLKQAGNSLVKNYDCMFLFSILC